MRKLMLVTGILLMLAAGAGAYWFEPWKLFTNTTVNDTAPVILESGSAPSEAPAGSAPSATLVAQGDLISHEHTTSGTVQLVKLEDGTHQIVLRDLSTSDGPDLHVWLTGPPRLALSMSRSARCKSLRRVHVAKLAWRSVAWLTSPRKPRRRHERG